MKIHLLIISFFFLVALNSINAQIFPYLNASTGNENEFIVDTDSNIFMFHGSRIEKLDKNYNAIWMNDYSGIVFKNLLLSKTGSLYFIAKAQPDFFFNRIGKIEANGNLTWCKSIETNTVLTGTTTKTISPFNLNHIFLDRNNNLITVGTSGNTKETYFLKFDTLGNTIKFKVFDSSHPSVYSPETSIIVNDSLGFYSIASWGFAFEGSYRSYNFKYSDSLDTIIENTERQTYVGITGNGTYAQYGGRMFKSKINSLDYYLSYQTYGATISDSMTFTLHKNRNKTNLWLLQFKSYFLKDIRLQNIEEDNLKNIYVSLTSIDRITYKKDKYIIKVDSNGLCDNKKYFLNQNIYGVTNNDATDSLFIFNHHFGNKFFYSIGSSGLSVAPIHIMQMDSTVGELCIPASSITISSNYNSNPNQPNSCDSIVTVPSINTVSHFPIKTAITNTINLTSCLILNNKNHEDKTFILIYPNPTRELLNIINNNNTAIKEVSILNVNGKEVLKSTNSSPIKIEHLANGIYFIKIKTDQGEFSQKFIKE